MADIIKTDKQLGLSLQLVRKQTEVLCESLAIEDYVIQAMPDVSPTKWHLAHVTWFFEKFLLKPYLANYQIFHPHYDYLFNSYYQSLGSFHSRNQRGFLSRPTVAEIMQYRSYVDENLLMLIQQLNDHIPPKIMFRLQLGIQHEQQHQELLLMDLKYNFAMNPLQPSYRQWTNLPVEALKIPDWRWQDYEGGLCEIGFNQDGFAFDNEQPRHQIYLTPFKLSNRLVTNAEYLEFIEDNGYQQARYWLADGWDYLNQQQWRVPLYWELHDNKWWHMTLHGLSPVNLNQPVCHVSYYEANAYARFRNARLPTEAEWEVAVDKNTILGNFLESGWLHPIASNANSNGLLQCFGDVWEWTQSAYTPYPGFKAFAKEFSEYNAKFACNQFVLRGGCAVTPKDHIRATYRNFYYPHQRWPFTGIRLAGDL